MKKKRVLSAKAWVSNWKSLGPELERIEKVEQLKSNLADTLLSLSDVNQSALIAFPPTPDSGIIEMQRLFSKLRK